MSKISSYDMSKNTSKAMSKNGSKRRLRLLACLPAAVLLTALLVGCGSEVPADPAQEHNLNSELQAAAAQDYAIVCFGDPEGDCHIPLSLSINSTRDVVWVALEKLLSGPPNDFTAAAVPPGIKLADLQYQPGEIRVFLQGEEALTVEQVDVAAFAATIAANLDADGEPVDELLLEISYNEEALLAEPVALGTVNDYSEGAEDTLTVWFADSQAMYIAPISLAAPNDEGEELYTALLNSWLAGPPADSGLWQAVAEGTVLNGCRLQDGCLYIDLNAAALSYGGGSAFEYIFVQSLLANFIPYAEVEKLQLTIDGVKVDYLPEGTDIGTMLTVPENYSGVNRVS